jgi:hypothetical protein
VTLPALKRTGQSWQLVVVVVVVVVVVRRDAGHDKSRAFNIPGVAFFSDGHGGWCIALLDTWVG